eukprot:EG_transcript_3141
MSVEREASAASGGSSPGATLRRRGGHRFKGRSKFHRITSSTADCVERIARGCILEEGEDLTGILEWIVDAAGQAHAYPATRRLLHAVLSAEDFLLRAMTPVSFTRLQVMAKEQLAAIASTRSRELHEDTVAALGFEVPSLVRPDCAGKRPAQSNLFLDESVVSNVLPPLDTLLVPASEAETMASQLSFSSSYAGSLSSSLSNLFREEPLKGLDDWVEELWDFDNPVRMHEQVYVHILRLVALAVHEGFQHQVKAAAEAALPGEPAAHYGHPPKDFHRMAAKLVSPADHRYERLRPRPALNADVVRCTVTVATPADVPRLLAALSEHFGGLVHASNTYAARLDGCGGPSLPMVTVNVLYDAECTYHELRTDPRVRQRWAEYGRAGKAYLDGLPEARREAQVEKAMRWLGRGAVAEHTVRVIGEVRVTTAATHRLWQRTEELHRIMKAMCQRALLRDYRRVPPPTPQDPFTAAEQGELRALQTLLRAGKVNATRPSGGTALDLAACHGHPDVVDFLLRQQAAPHNAQLPQPALVMAAAQGHLAGVTILLRSKANPNKRGLDGTPPLVAAAASGFTDVVQVLLAMGADPERPAHPKKMVRFLKAASAAQNPFVGPATRLPEQRFDRLTPLCAAARHGHPQVVELLLEGNATPNTPDGSGHTPLMEATACGHHLVARVLVAARADPDLAPRGLPSPLCVAAQHGYAPLLAVLLEARADPSRGDPRGQSPLFLAAAEGHAASVTTLLTHNADADQPRPDGWTPLYAALANWHPAAARALLAHGAAPHCRLASQSTPLLLATMKGYPDLVDTLLARQADPNHADVEGHTPLVCAVAKGRQRVAAALLAARADPNRGDG